MAMPSVADLKRMRVAKYEEYEMSNKEVERFRRLLYSINKQGQYRFRTMRDEGILIVWRFK